VEADALKLGLLGMVAIANGLLLPGGQGGAGGAQFAGQLLGVFATGGQKPYGFFLELSTVSVAVLFTHRLLSTVLSHCPQLRGRPTNLPLDTLIYLNFA